jgi:hypothetical protein
MSIAQTLSNMLNKNLKYCFCILTTGVSLVIGNNQANAALMAKGYEDIFSFSLEFTLPLAVPDTWRSQAVPPNAVPPNKYTYNNPNNVNDPKNGTLQSLNFWLVSLTLPIFNADIGNQQGNISLEHLVDPHVNAPPAGGLTGGAFSFLDPPVGILKNTQKYTTTHKDSQGKHRDDYVLTLNSAAKTLTVQGSHISCDSSVVKPSFIAQIDNIIRSTFISPVYAQTFPPISEVCQVPEPSPTLSILVIGGFGLLGAASTLNRKLKSSKSSEKDNTKTS